MPVTNEAISRRVERVRNAMRERGLVALIIYAASPILAHATGTSGNVRYLTNCPAPKYESSLLVLPLQAEPTLFVARPLAIITGRAALQRQRGEELSWVSDIRLLTAVPLGTRSVVREVLEERDVPAGRIGIVGGREMTADIYLGVTRRPSRWEFEDADELLAIQRAVKDEAEIELHRVAAKISDAMLYAGMNAARAERRWASDIMVEMEHAGRSLGAEQAQCWVATGQAPELVLDQLKDLFQPVLDGDRVQSGTFVTFDGYWAHGLRVGVKGKPLPDVRRNFERVLEIQNAGLAQLRPGKPLADAHKAMADLADEYSPYPRGKDPGRFRHGHVLGLDYAEPIMSAAFPRPDAGSEGGRHILVQVGMVLELHPNFGVPGMGFFCVGDTVLVTETRPEVLTKFPRDMYEI